MALTDLNAVTDARINRRLEPISYPVRNLDDFHLLKEIWRERLMVPILLQDRSEGLDVSFGGRDSRLLLTGDESAGRYAIEDVFYTPGWETPAYHMAEADEHWYIVDGEVEITVGSLTETCRKGSFAYIPRNTTRRLRNTGPSAARLFQWSAPAGFDRALQELAKTYRENPDVTAAEVCDILVRFAVVVHEGPVDLEADRRVNGQPGSLPFDSQSLEDFMRLRELWAVNPMIPKIIHDKSQGILLDVIPDADSWCILSGDESGGKAMVMMNGLPPGLFVPPHYQPTEEELFYAVDEGLWWNVCGKELHTRIGSFAFAPRYGTHRFGNPTEGRSSFITINSPAGHERGLAKVKDSDITLEENRDFFLKWGWFPHEEA